MAQNNPVPLPSSDSQGPVVTELAQTNKSLPDSETPFSRNEGLSTSRDVSTTGEVSSTNKVPSTETDSLFFLIAIPSSSPTLLTYAVPDDLSDDLKQQLRNGTLVRIDIRGKPKIGVLWQKCEKPSFPCKPTSGTLFGAPALPETLMRLMEWTSLYYLCPLPRLIHLCAPGAIWKPGSDDTRQKRFSRAAARAGKDAHDSLKMISNEETSTSFPNLDTRLRGEKVWPNPEHVTLADEQISALERLGQARRDPQQPQTFLLEGITGSGKTEVYLSAAKDMLKSGRSVLVLVPEIALTPQMTMRFRAWFGDDLAVIHSGLTQAEMEREWYRIILGQAKIVLGVRRGIFAPLGNVGLIIVDEEHDSSYKSDDYPCVHARDVAVKRAQIEGAICVLGSASPSLETSLNVQSGRYGHIKLSRRQKGASPQIEIFDSRPFYKTIAGQNSAGSAKRNPQSLERSSQMKFGQSVILPPIISELERCRARGQQSMIIVNRRGYAHFSICLDCGQPQSCPHCAVSTTLHKGGRLEICHHCGYQTPHRKSCASCHGTRLEDRGFGTQMVEADIANQLPHLRTERLDRDVLTSPTRLSELLDRFRRGESDTLIGTQILAKGHDFPRVSLVAILHLEDALFLPDFRSAERTFQLLLQSAGRAGRGDIPGRVIVQSLIPEHPVLQAVLGNKMETFYRDELASRRLAGLPPFTRQISLILEHAEEDILSRDAFQAKKAVDAMSLSSGLQEKIRIIGPHPAPIERLDGRFRAMLTVCLPKSVLPRQVIPLELQADHYGASKLKLDVDPFSFF